MNRITKTNLGIQTKQSHGYQDTSIHSRHVAGEVSNLRQERPMVIDHTRPSPPDRTRQEAALVLLNPLIGMWNLEVHVPTQPPTNIWRLWSFFEWMDGGMFLTWQWGPSQPNFPGDPFPSAHSIIGYDDTTQLYFVHYFDARGIYRVLDMSLENQIWKMWWNGPDLSQRINGTIAEDRNTITLDLEMSRDGVTWQHDFDMLFTRAV